MDDTKMPRTYLNVAKSRGSNRRTALRIAFRNSYGEAVIRLIYTEEDISWDSAL